ncbi:hypothetical protein [Methylobacterium sp. J-070]|uniref:hypothetical protein n=1 Tax=Methylobacterium sp. J-070 TaxID=2836650 RepID=UPI001FBBF94D|nr:hypothetical protein [Methylobacterium sp. J-070]MCJ2051209.1 hypothetical protein [Methylobacterium sp. J-070]
MTNRYSLSANSPEALAAAEDARRLLARAGKSRDEDQDEGTDKKLEDLATTPGRDDDTDDALDDVADDEDRDDDEDQDGEKADERAGRRGRRAAIRAAVDADRARSAKVMELARAAGLPNFGRRHIEYGTSVREFRQALKERQGKPGARALHEQPSFNKEVSRGAREAQRTLGKR